MGSMDELRSPSLPTSPAAPVIVFPSPSMLSVLQLLGTIRCPRSGGHSARTKPRGPRLPANRSNGSRGIEGRPQRLGDKLKPIERANGCQHMRGVGSLPPPGLEDAELSGDLEHPLQQALLRATGQKTVSKLAEDTKVKARVGQLEAKKVLPVDPRPDRLSGLSIAQALAELHQRDQGQAPGWAGRLALLGIEVGEVAILEDRPERVAQGEIGAAFGKGGASNAGSLFGHGRERLLRVERHGGASRDYCSDAALGPQSHPFANGIGILKRDGRPPWTASAFSPLTRA